MKRVSIQQLRTKLSECLRAVRNGETVLVTDHDEIVAALRPERRNPAAVDSLEGILDSLAKRGELTRASLPKGRWKWKAKGLGLPPGTANALLDEIRSDR